MKILIKPSLLTTFVLKQLSSCNIRLNTRLSSQLICWSHLDVQIRGKKLFQTNEYRRLCFRKKLWLKDSLLIKFDLYSYHPEIVLALTHNLTPTEFVKFGSV